MLVKKNRFLGISLNVKEMYLVDLEKKGKELYLHSMDVLPLPEDAYADGLILEDTQLKESLTNYVRERKLKGSRAIVGVNPRQAVIRPIRVPQMTEKELRKALEYEVDRYFSLANVTYTMDYIRQGIVEGDGTIQEDVLAIAIKDSVLESLCELTTSTGLKIAALDVEPNAFVYLRTFAAQQSVWPELENDWAAIELGVGKTMVSFFRDNVLQFVHTTPIVYENDPGVVADLLRELDRAFNYYHMNLRKPLINRVYLWGKQAEQAARQFEEVLAYTFISFPLDKVAEALNNNGELPEDGVIALGLALREVVE
ncbi:MAG: pilus assembly protein PilM [Peptococcia bacterium]